MPLGMTIGRLAQAAGINVETIRYYQRRGLLVEPRRPPGGQRRYSPETVRQLAFIRRAQQLGFSLEEVKGLLALEHGRDAAATRDMAERKLVVLQARMDELARMKRELKRLLARSGKAGAGRDGFIEALFEPAKPVRSP